jgi:chromate transport protein ChrA
MRLPEVIRREIRVACSTRVQSSRVRILKWTIFVIATAVFYRSRTYWYAVLAIFFAGLLVHLLYRTKTKAWSQPWGGWNDVETAYPNGEGRFGMRIE